jgi:hypothetical protein
METKQREANTTEKNTSEDYEVPKVIISLSLEKHQTLSSDTCQKWLVSCPALIQHAKIEAVYKGFSALILLSIPISLWDLLPEHPACSFVGYVTSQNLLRWNSPILESVSEPTPLPAPGLKSTSPPTESSGSVSQPPNNPFTPKFLQNQLSVQTRHFSSLQDGHDKLLAEFSRSQIRVSELERRHAVSNSEIIRLSEEKIQLQAQVIELSATRSGIPDKSNSDSKRKPLSSANAFSPYRMERGEAMSPELRNATQSPSRAVYRFAGFGTPFSEMDIPVTAVPLGPTLSDNSNVKSTTKVDTPLVSHKQKSGIFEHGTTPAKHYRSSRDSGVGSTDSDTSYQSSLRIASSDGTYYEVEILSAVQEALDFANEKIRQLEAANTKLNPALAEATRKNRFLMREKLELLNELNEANDNPRKLNTELSGESRNPSYKQCSSSSILSRDSGYHDEQSSTRSGGGPASREMPPPPLPQHFMQTPPPDPVSYPMAYSTSNMFAPLNRSTYYMVGAPNPIAPSNASTYMAWPLPGLSSREPPPSYERPRPKVGTAGIYSDMTVDGPEIGTLVVIVDRAKNLPNRNTIGKQDPYCAARLGKEAKKTDTDRRGEQAPRWDQELRYTVHDSPDYYQLKISVFNDDKKMDLIGETWVDLKEVVVAGGGQNDLWHNLNCKGKYAGEIRIEITYYDTRPKQEKAEKWKQLVTSFTQPTSPTRWS